MNQVDLNSKAYCLLYQLENNLRDFIVQQLSDIAGASWQDERIPESTLKDWERRKREEMNNLWVEPSQTDLIYFADFTDLKKIIEKKDNWSQCFRQYFGRNKDIVQTKLQELGPIRNKIAHNRSIQVDEYDKLYLYYKEIRRLIGNATSLDPKIAFGRQLDEEMRSELRVALNELQAELINNLMQIGDLEQISLSTLEVFVMGWWYGADVLDLNEEQFNELLKILQGYRGIPRFPGVRASLQSYITENQIKELIQDALNNLEVERQRISTSSYSPKLTAVDVES